MFHNGGCYWLKFRLDKFVMHVLGSDGSVSRAMWWICTCKGRIYLASRHWKAFGSGVELQRPSLGDHICEVLQALQHTCCKSLGTSSLDAAWKNSCSTPITTSGSLMSQNIWTTWKAESINSVTPRHWTIAAVFWESFTSSVNFPSWKKITSYWEIGRMSIKQLLLLILTCSFPGQLFQQLEQQMSSKKGFCQNI